MSDTELITELGSYNMVAGDYSTFVFACVDENGAPININSAVCTMKMCPYGDTSTVVLTKTGTIIAPTTNGIFEVYLTLADTQNLYGVYECFPQVLDIDNKTFRSGIVLVTIKASPN